MRRDNQDLPPSTLFAGSTCAACRVALDPGKGRRWTFRRFFARADTEIWLCGDCAPAEHEVVAACASCREREKLGRIPLCMTCLFAYEANARELKAGRAGDNDRACAAPAASSPTPPPGR